MRAAMSATLLRAMAMLLAGLVLVGCTRLPPKPRIVLPTLHLAPAAYGGSVALQQRLRFEFGPQRREMDALLEIDADAVRLAVQAMARTGVTLVWDGNTLQQTRADWLPAAVRGERVLDDLQFVHWPVDAIRAALPTGWSVDAGSAGGVESRRLMHGRDVLFTASSPWAINERMAVGAV